ncbi:hypothetical protein Tco_1344855 [Tanacetum coccineum]
MGLLYRRTLYVITSLMKIAVHSDVRIRVMTATSGLCSVSGLIDWLVGHQSKQEATAILNEQRPEYIAAQCSGMLVIEILGVRLKMQNSSNASFVEDSEILAEIIKRNSGMI